MVSRTNFYLFLEYFEGFGNKKVEVEEYEERDKIRGCSCVRRVI